MGNKIRVCHVTSVHSRYDTRIFYKECSSLAKAGYDVTLLVADGLHDELLNGVHIISVTKRTTSRFQRILKSAGLMLGKALEVDAEIYHLHDPELLPLGMKMKKYGKKVIFDSHENYPAQIKTKYYIPAFARHLASQVYKFYETNAVSQFDAVITPCTFYNGVDIFGERCKKTEVISNAPLLSEFYDKYKANVRKENAPMKLCHVGGLTYERGITHLIKASYKAGTILMLAGKFSPEGYHEELMKMPEYNCVDYRGFLSRDSLVDFYHEANVGVATILNVGQYNTGDNFATKVYEYMSMSLPVIISKYPYVEKMLKNYEFGITVNPVNIKEITNVIKYCKDHYEERARMGKNGRCAIFNKLNWNIEEQKLVRLYKTLSLS